MQSDRSYRLKPPDTAVLLFQDIAVIPILVFLPILATSIPNAVHDVHQSLISSFPGWIQAGIIVGSGAGANAVV